MRIATEFQKFMFTTVLLLATSTCARYPFVEQTGGATVVDKNSLTIVAPKVDILMVIDNSGSMMDKQARVKESMAQFIAELTAGNADYHIGIVTTDILAATDGGRLRMAADKPPYQAAPAPNDPDRVRKQQDIVNNVNAAVSSLGTAGSGSEAGLQAAVLALTSTDEAVVARNKGFLRSDADLAVVVVSDEDDCSPQAAHLAEFSTWNVVDDTADCQLHASFLSTPQDLLNALVAAKGSVAKLRFAMIVGGVVEAGTFKPMGCIVQNDQPSVACGCWLYSSEQYYCDTLSSRGQPCSIYDATCGGERLCRSSPASLTCDTPVCSVVAGDRYSSFATLLEQERQAAGAPSGVYRDSICQTSFSNALLTAVNVAILDGCFAVADPNATQTIAVTVAHTKVPVDGSTVQTLFTDPVLVPRLDPTAASSSNAVCTDCRNCPGNAWQLSADHRVCLACSMTRQLGDRFDVSTVNQSTP